MFESEKHEAQKPATGILGPRDGRLVNAFVLTGSTETLGGLLLAGGLLTPFAAAIIISVMTAASIAVHRTNGFFATDGGYELPLLIAVVAGTIALLGPGRYSLDAALGTIIDGVLPAVAAVIVGMLIGIAVVAAREVAQRPGVTCRPRAEDVDGTFAPPRGVPSAAHHASRRKCPAGWGPRCSTPCHTDATPTPSRGHPLVRVGTKLELDLVLGVEQLRVLDVGLRLQRLEHRQVG